MKKITHQSLEQALDAQELSETTILCIQVRRRAQTPDPQFSNVKENLVVRHKVILYNKFTRFSIAAVISTEKTGVFFQYTSVKSHSVKLLNYNIPFYSKP